MKQNRTLVEMMRFLFMLLVIALSLSSCWQEHDHPNFVEMKFVTEPSRFEKKIKAQLTYTSHYADSNRFFLSSKEIYDEHGRKIATMKYSQDSDDSISNTIYYKYNGERLIEEIEIDSNKWYRVELHTYIEYTSSGKELRKRFKLMDNVNKANDIEQLDSTVNVFDNKDNIVKTTHFFKGDSSWSIHMKYDLNNQLIEKTVHNPEPYDQWKYTYADGLMMEEKLIRPRSNLTYITKYTYYKNKNPAENKTYLQTRDTLKLMYTLKYEYEYYE